MAQRCMFDETEEAAVLMTNLEEGETVGVCGAHVPEFFQLMADQTRRPEVELTEAGMAATDPVSPEEEAARDQGVNWVDPEADSDAETDEDEDMPAALRLDSAVDSEARLAEPPPKAARTRKPRSA